jgi:hypothetical protein
VDLTVFARAMRNRAMWISAVTVAAVVLGACSGTPGSSVTGATGISVGVTAYTSTGTTVVQQGQKLYFTASVTADPSGAGVTWALDGGGTLSDITKTTVTYTAPTGITGSISPILTATAVVDKTQSFTALLLVEGTPVIDPTTLFPANVGTAYSAQVSVSGGLDPYTWVLVSGALPPGLTLSASTSSIQIITGTPTTLGTYNFQLKATDANKKDAAVDLSITVNPLTACLLSGQYATVYSG